MNSIKISALSAVALSSILIAGCGEQTPKAAAEASKPKPSYENSAVQKDGTVASSPSPSAAKASSANAGAAPSSSRPAGAGAASVPAASSSAAVSRPSSGQGGSSWTTAPVSKKSSEFGKDSAQLSSVKMGEGVSGNVSSLKLEKGTSGGISKVGKKSMGDVAGMGGKAANELPPLTTPPPAASKPVVVAQAKPQASASGAQAKAPSSSAKPDSASRNDKSGATVNTLPPSAGLAGVADQGAIESVGNYATGLTQLTVKKNVTNKIKKIQSKHDDDLNKALNDK